jgi:hypothetical protein
MSSVFGVGFNDALPGQSEQADIELVYVKTANDVMTAQLQSLENGMTATQTVLNTLAQVQQLKNLIEPVSKGAFNSATFNLSSTAANLYYGHNIAPTDPATGYSIYAGAASAFFGTPVSVKGSFTSLNSTGTGTFGDFQVKLNAIRSAMALEIAQLSEITPSGALSANSLLATLRIVYNDSAGATANTAAALTWITDDYNAVASSAVSDAGNLQQHITNAITAGQTLNSTQTENLQSYMYLFEEYYKSASAILQAITQIIQKMADNAAQ